MADIGIVGENEYVEKGQEAKLIKRLGFSKCRLSLAIPKDEEYKGLNGLREKRSLLPIPRSYGLSWRRERREGGYSCNQRLRGNRRALAWRTLSLIS